MTTMNRLENKNKNKQQQHILHIFTDPRLSLLLGSSSSPDKNEWKYSITSSGQQLKLHSTSHRSKFNVSMNVKSKQVYIRDTYDYLLPKLSVNGINLVTVGTQIMNQEFELNASNTVDIQSRITVNNIVINGKELRMKKYAILNVKSFRSQTQVNLIDGTIYCTNSDLTLMFNGNVRLATDASIGKHFDNKRNELCCSSLKLSIGDSLVNYGRIKSTDSIYIECAGLITVGQWQRNHDLGFDTPQLGFEALVRTHNEHVSPKHHCAPTEIYKAIGRRDIANVIQILNDGNINPNIGAYVAKLLTALRRTPNITTRIQNDITALQHIANYIEWKFRQSGVICAPVIHFVSFGDLEDLYQFKSTDVLNLDVHGSVTLRSSSPRWHTGTLRGNINACFVLNADTVIKFIDKMTIGKSFQNEGYCLIRNGGSLYIGEIFENNSHIRCTTDVLWLNLYSFKTRENSLIDGSQIHLIVRGTQPAEHFWLGRICCDDLRVVIYQQQICQARFNVQNSVALVFPQLAAQLSIDSRLQTARGHVTVNGGHGTLVLTENGSIQCGATLFIDQIQQLINHGCITSTNTVIKLFQKLENQASIIVSNRLVIGCQNNIVNKGRLHASEIWITCSQLDNINGVLMSEQNMQVIQWAKEKTLFIVGTIDCQKVLRIQCPFTQELIFSPILSRHPEQLNISCANGHVDLETVTNINSIHVESKTGLRIQKECTIEQLKLKVLSGKGDQFVFQIDQNVKINQLVVSGEMESSEMKIIGKGKLTIQQLHVKDLTDLSFVLEQPVKIIDACIQIKNQLLIDNHIGISEKLYIKSGQLCLCPNGFLSIYQGEINSGRIHIQGGISIHTTSCSINGEDILFETSSKLNLFSRTKSDHSFQIAGKKSIHFYGLVTAKIIRPWGISSKGLVVIGGSFSGCSTFIEGLIVHLVGSINNQQVLEIRAIDSILLESTCNIESNEMTISTSGDGNRMIQISGTLSITKNCSLKSNQIAMINCTAHFNGPCQFEGDTIQLTKSDLKFYNNRVIFQAADTFDSSSNFFSNNEVRIEARTMTISGTLSGPGYTTKVPKQEKRTFVEKLKDYLGITAWETLIHELSGKDQQVEQSKVVVPIIGYVLIGYKITFDSAITECTTLQMNVKHYLTIAHDCRLHANEINIKTAWGFIRSEIMGTKFLQITSHGLLNTGTIKSKLFIQLKTHLAFINLGTIDCVSVKSIALIFINLFHIYAPRFVCQSVVSLFLLGLLRSFQFQQVSILHFEGLHVTVPTIPTWDQLTDIGNTIDAVLNTAKNFCPPQVRAAINMFQTIKSLVCIIPQACLLVKKLVQTIKGIKSDGMSFDVITSLIEIICGIIPVYSAARTCIETTARANANMGSSNAASESVPSITVFNVATTLAGNLIGPRYSYTSVGSAAFGARISHNINEMGISGYNGGLNLTTGTQISDYAYSYTQRGVSLACGDIICSARYLKQQGIMMSARNISLEGYEVTSKLTLAYQRIGITATKQAVVENAFAGTLLADVKDGDLTITNVNADNLNANGISVRVITSHVQSGTVEGQNDVSVQGTNGKFTVKSHFGDARIENSQSSETNATGVNVYVTNSEISSGVVGAKNEIGVQDSTGDTFKLTSEQGTVKVDGSTMTILDAQGDKINLQTSTIGTGCMLGTSSVTISRTTIETLLAEATSGKMNLTDSKINTMDAKGFDVVVGQSNIEQGHIQADNKALVTDSTVTRVFVEGIQEASVDNSHVGEYLQVQSDGLASIKNTTGDTVILKGSQVDLGNTNHDLSNLKVMTKQIPGIDSLISHTGEYAGLKIRNNLDLAVSDQAVRFSTDLLLSHGLIVSATNIDINAKVTSNSGNIALQTTTGDMILSPNANIHANDGSVVLHSDSNFKMEKSSDVFGSKTVDMASNGKFELNQAVIKGHNVFLVSKDDQTHLNSDVSSSDTTYIESTEGRALLKATHADAGQLLYVKANQIDIEHSERFVSGSKGSQMKEYTKTTLTGGTGKEHGFEHTDKDGKQFSDIRQVGLILESKDKMKISPSIITSQSDNLIQGGTVELKADAYKYTQSETESGLFNFNERTITDTRTHVERPEIISIHGRNIIRATDGSIETIAANIESADGNILTAQKDVDLYDIAGENRSSIHKSSWWGITSEDRTERHQTSTGTQVVSIKPDSQTVINSETGSINLVGSTVQTKGHFSWSAAKDITVTDPVLDHQVDVTKRGVFLETQIFHKDSAITAVQDLAHSGGIISGAATTIFHTLPEVQTAIRQFVSTDSQNLAEVALDRTGVTNPSISFGYRTEKTSQRYQTLAQSGVFVSGHADIHADTLTINNAAQLHFADDLLVDVQNFSFNGVQLQNSFSQEVNLISVSASLRDGLGDMKYSHSVMDSSTTTTVKQNTFVGGTATFRDGASGTLTGVDVDLNSTKGHLKDMNIISLQDTYHLVQESFSLSTAPSVSFSTNKQEGIYVNEQSTLTIGHTLETPLTIDNLYLRGATMIAGNDAHVQIDHVSADELQDQTSQSSFGATNLKLAFSKEHSTAVNRPTVVGNNVQMSVVQGSLNTDVHRRHELLEEKHMEVHADISAVVLQRLVHPPLVHSVLEISDEMRDNAKLYAALSDLVYSTDGDVNTMSDALQSYLPGKDGKMPEMLHDWKVAQTDKRTAVFVNENTHKVVVAYRGKAATCISFITLLYFFSMTAGTRDLVDYIVDIGIVTTGVPLLNNANAERFFQDVQRTYPDYTISTTGHSLGGKQAELIAMKYNVSCWSYNPGAGLPTVQAFEQNNVNNNNVQINRFLVQNDIISFMNSIQSAQGPNIVNIRLPKQDGMNAHSTENFTDAKTSFLWNQK